MPNLARPQRFTEHLFVQKLFGDHSALTVLTNKVAVKEVVAATLGASFVTPTLWHGAALPPREQRTWPVPFVLKANFGSDMNAFVRTAADLDWDALEARVEGWLRTDWPAWMCEDWYNTFEHEVLVEPLLQDETGDLPDYKVQVFFGQALFIQVDTGRNTPNHARSYYDRGWTRQEFWNDFPLTGEPHPPPRHLDEMLQAAEVLGEGFDFVRVDFYDLPDGPRFGEMTFVPGAGFDVFEPKGYDLALGRLWEERRAAATAMKAGIKPQRR